MKTLLLLSALAVTTAASAKDAKVEMSAWVKCLRDNAARYAAQPISVETAATATMGACQDEENAANTMSRKTPFAERLIGGPRSMNSEYVDRADSREARTRTEFHDRVITLIVEARAAN